jgi:predicted DNA-binding protein
MAQRPLSPRVGKAAKVYARFPDEALDRLDRLVARKGVTRSQYLRAALEAAIAADEAVEAAKAS